MASTENIRCVSTSSHRADDVPSPVAACRRLLDAALQTFLGDLCCHAGPAIRGLHKYISGVLRSVYVRVRPLNEAEAKGGAAWRVEGNAVFQVDPASEGRLSDNSYKLDAIFDGR